MLDTDRTRPEGQKPQARRGEQDRQDRKEDAPSNEGAALATDAKADPGSPKQSTARLGPPAPEAAEKERSKWRTVAWYAALAAVAGFAAWLIVRALLPPILPVLEVRSEGITRMLAVTGRVEAQQSVTVSARGAGRIAQIAHYEGEPVQAGDVLARLEDTTLGTGVTQQAAALSASRKQLANQTRELARAEKLAQTGAMSQEELDRARLDVERGKDDLVGLTAALKEQQTQLVVTAPFAGTIVRRDAEVGQVVGPETSLFEIATVASARVTAEIDERYVSALRPGMRAEVMLLGVSQKVEKAQVSYVAQAVDPQTGAATVRFSYDKPPSKVLVGASVDVNISVDSVPRAITIPRESIGTAHGRSFVLVVRDGAVQRREVSVDDWPAERVVVLRGLKAGETIATDPSSVTPGKRVRAEVSRAL